MTASQYYKSYVADDTISPLSEELIKTILNYRPMHVLDFGSGSGKHSNILNREGIVTLAIDISMMNTVRAHAKYDLPFVACTNETYLGHLANIDVVFTCSVLDHIEDVSNIIKHFQRIANKSVVLAETQNSPDEFYYSHDYERFGFKKLSASTDIDFRWRSEPPEGDGATYHIWVWNKTNGNSNDTHDDLA